MRAEQWETVRDQIAERFAIAEEGSEPLADVPSGTVEFIVFDAPIGRVRLERVEKPRTLGERAHTSRRIGGDVAVEKVYDEGDRVAFLRAFRWDDGSGGWVEMRADSFT